MRFEAIHILVNDLQKAYDFYHRLLGFTILNDTNCSMTLKAGKTKLELSLSTEQQGTYHLAFHIPNNQLQNALQWVGKKTVILPTGEGQLVADFTNWNARSFYFMDPFQNILEFITHFDLKVQSKIFSGAAGITHIIEAGVVTANVPALCEQLKKNHGLDYFNKGPLTESFAVIGDEEGMLIISQAGRNWFPTSQPAVSIDMRLNIIHNESQFTLLSIDLY